MFKKGSTNFEIHVRRVTSLYFDSNDYGVCSVQTQINGCGVKKIQYGAFINASWLKAECK